MLVKNAIKCNFCKKIIQSLHRHDHKSCKCGRVAIDGGLSCPRILFTSPDDYIDKSIVSDDFEVQRLHVRWGVNYTKTGKLRANTVWKPIAKLETDHIEAILKNVKKIDLFWKQLLEKELEYRKTI